MTDKTLAERLTQARAELWWIVTCRCGPEYRDRRMHHPDCHYDSKEALVTILDALDAKDREIERLRNALKLAHGAIALGTSPEGKRQIMAEISAALAADDEAKP